MTDIRAGDEVRVFGRIGRRSGQPESGVVVNVGRKLVTIKHGGREQVFRLDTCKANDNYGHQWFRTLERVALDDRMHAALAVLRGHHITIEHHRASLTLGQIEALAEVAKTFGKG